MPTTSDTPTERGGDDGIKVFVERRRDGSFTAFRLRFRREIGRPMTKEEHRLAALAYGCGFHDGLGLALSALEER